MTNYGETLVEQSDVADAQTQWTEADTHAAAQVDPGVEAAVIVQAQVVAAEVAEACVEAGSRPMTFTRLRVSPKVRSMKLECRMRFQCSRGNRR